MASDMHFGKLSGVSLKKVCSSCKMRWNLILFYCQDIIDDHPGCVHSKEYGTNHEQNESTISIWCLGNHEYYGRAVPEFLQEMDKIDIRILLDEVITIEDDFYLVGRRDKTERASSKL